MRDDRCAAEARCLGQDQLGFETHGIGDGSDFGFGAGDGGEIRVGRGGQPEM